MHTGSIGSRRFMVFEKGGRFLQQKGSMGVFSRQTGGGRR